MKTIIAGIITVIFCGYLSYSTITFFEAQEARLAVLEKDVKSLHIAPMFLSKDGTCWYIRGEKTE